MKRVSLLSLGLLAATPGFAQILPRDYMLVGAGVRTRPAYDGSSSQTTDLIPVIRYYGHPWFARTTQGVLEGGIRTEVATGLSIGAQLAYEEGRKASESTFLSSRNFPDIDPDASIGVHTEYERNFGRIPVDLLVRYRRSMDSDRGAQADIRLNAGVFERGSAVAVLFFQVTWASEKSNRFFYGISDQQSATTGLPAFSPGGGWLSSSAGLIGGADLTSTWTLLGSLTWRHLEGGPSRSPITERTSNYYANVGLAYRF
jgi:outer membrane scaffolding protein for murein synthesis (MipA/OmpV family)